MGWRHSVARFGGHTVVVCGGCGQECAVGGAGVGRLVDS